MNRFIALCLSIFGITGAVAAESVAWSPLPKDGFISGRAASKADVEAGRAVFVAAKGDVIIGKPIAMQIPQYAWHKEGNRKTPVVVIQAEEASGQKIIGARLSDGQYLAGTLAEFELLGMNTPK
ncbi:MAG: hypothetical protein E6Q78_14030 [Rhodoferax sp.]|nr:MAG: hypothetical protein E6Q78_14030 [Rhodoferax sp.]